MQEGSSSVQSVIQYNTVGALNGSGSLEPSPPLSFSAIQRKPCLVSCVHVPQVPRRVIRYRMC